MNGGLDMKKFFNNRFALTDQGAKDITKATMSSFFCLLYKYDSSYIAYAIYR